MKVYGLCYAGGQIRMAQEWIRIHCYDFLKPNFSWFFFPPIPTLLPRTDWRLFYFLFLFHCFILNCRVWPLFSFYFFSEPNPEPLDKTPTDSSWIRFSPDFKSYYNARVLAVRKRIIPNIVKNSKCPRSNRRYAQVFEVEIPGFFSREQTQPLRNSKETLQF